MKKIMILGAGILQLPAIKKAKEIIANETKEKKLLGKIFLLTTHESFPIQTTNALIIK